MKSVQLKMARAAVGWGVRELAEQAGFTANTVTRIENGADAKQSTIDAIRAALEAAGVEFTNGGQPGVRLRPLDRPAKVAWFLQKNERNRHFSSLAEAVRFVVEELLKEQGAHGVSIFAEGWTRIIDVPTSKALYDRAKSA